RHARRAVVAGRARLRPGVRRPPAASPHPDRGAEPPGHRAAVRRRARRRYGARRRGRRRVRAGAHERRRGDGVNLRDLSYLIAVAEEGHFGRAAAECSVSQPTLSTQLRKLERELGVTLIERARGGVLLTPVGAQVVEHARVALGAVAEMQAVARAAHDPESGIVQLGVLPTSGPYLMPHVLRRVRERYPRVQVRLVEEKTDA